MHGDSIVAIETSQREGGVALRDAAGVLHVERLAPSKRHDDDLMPAIDRMFARARLEPAALSAVGVSIGPGGFTGLRIAVSVAKMFALALGARVVAVPSALVAAESDDEAVPPGAWRLVALACKRDSLWATVLARDGSGAWITRSEAGGEGAGARVGAEGDAGAVEAVGGALVSSETAPLDGVAVVLGDRYLPERLRARCRTAGIPVREPRFDPAACLVLTERRLERGLTCDPLTLAPLYPRPPEAVSLWEQRHGGQAPGSPAPA